MCPADGSGKLHASGTTVRSSEGQFVNTGVHSEGPLYLFNRRWKQENAIGYWCSTYGSVIGPILYSLYNKPVSDIIYRFGLLHHSYVDGTQHYYY